MRKNLADLLHRDELAVEQWLAQSFVGVWPLPLSCEGCKVPREVPECILPAQSGRPSPGCPSCKRHVVLAIRGATQHACRLRLANNGERKWMLRATHN